MIEVFIKSWVSFGVKNWNVSTFIHGLKSLDISRIRGKDLYNKVVVPLQDDLQLASEINLYSTRFLVPKLMNMDSTIVLLNGKQKCKLVARLFYDDDDVFESIIDVTSLNISIDNLTDILDHISCRTSIINSANIFKLADFVKSGLLVQNYLINTMSAGCITVEPKRFSFDFSSL
ncbi:hypothetical protein GEMRC1_008683 [Eukaryota sp. GEM-RC1]